MASIKRLTISAPSVLKLQQKLAEVVLVSLQKFKMLMLGLVSNHKIVCVTHILATTGLIKKTTTLQSSNAENTNI
jgi:hypothetical protein